MYHRGVDTIRIFGVDNDTKCIYTESTVDTICICKYKDIIQRE